MSHEEWAAMSVEQMVKEMDRLTELYVRDLERQAGQDREWSYWIACIALGVAVGTLLGMLR